MDDAAQTMVGQMKAGRNAESPEAQSTSPQLRDYIAGRAVELSHHDQSSTLLVRSADNRNGVTVYSYLDLEGQGRVQSAWHRWDFGSTGQTTLIATAPRKTGFTLFFHERRGEDVFYLACEQRVLPLSTDPDPFRTVYLDAWLDSSQAAATNMIPDSTSIYAGPYVYRDETLQGQAWADYPGFTDGSDITGLPYTSSFTPTRPVVRDRSGKSIMTGRLTVTKLFVRTVRTMSYGFTCYEDTAGAAFQSVYVNREVTGVLRSLPDPDILLEDSTVLDPGILGTTETSLFIGHDAARYTATISSRAWLPLNITDVQWVGQFFNRPQRI
jgi:hypothetical protein